MQTIVVLALVALPSSTASNTKAATPSAGQQPVSVKARGSLISILRTTLATFEGAQSGDPSANPLMGTGDDVALGGAGGGLDVLEANEEGKIDKSDKTQDGKIFRPWKKSPDLGKIVPDEANEEGEIFRPWKTRFQLKPFDFDSHKFQKPENRLSYRHFYAANPRLAEAPGSRDRNAQSDVLMVFGFTALAAVISGVLIITKLEVLRADELSLVSYQSKMLQVIIYAAVPWLLLGMYLLTIFVSFVGNPMRYARGTYHWQCGAMTWFIFVAPIINLLFFTSHAVWIGRVCFSVEQQAPMGQMFSLAMLPHDQQLSRDPITSLTNMLSHSAVRQMLFFFEVLCAIVGYMLITFRWGANSQFCNPEVYWSATALCVTVIIVIIFTSLAFVCSIFLRAASVSPWMQDFAESFWQADLQAKIARNESKDDKLRAKAEAEAANEEYESQFTEWRRHEANEQFAEERERHEAITKEHEEYQESHKEAAAQRIPEEYEYHRPQRILEASDQTPDADPSFFRESPEEPSPNYYNSFGASMPYGAQPMAPGTMQISPRMFGSMPPGTLQPGPVAPGVSASAPYRVDQFLPPGSHGPGALPQSRAAHPVAPGVSASMPYRVDQFLPPGTHLPGEGALPPSILGPESMQPGTLPPGTLPPSVYGFQGPMSSILPGRQGPFGSMGSFAAAASGSLPPGSVRF